VKKVRPGVVRKKRWYKRLRYLLEWCLIRFFCGVLNCLPIAEMRFLAGVFGVLGSFLFLPLRWRIASNIRFALPGISSGRLRHLLNRVFAGYTANFVELIRATSLRRGYFARHWRVMGKAHLEGALRRGRGVMLFSAHTGLFPLIGGLFGLAGDRFSFLVKLPNNPYISAHFERIASRMRMRFIRYRPRREAARGVMAALRAGEIVCIVGDEPRPEEGVTIRFFGREVSAPRGPAVLALRTGAAFLCAFACSCRKGHTLYIYPVKKVPSTRDEDSIRQLTQAANDVFETFLREHLSDWSWFRNRWKG